MKDIEEYMKDGQIDWNEWNKDYLKTHNACVKAEQNELKKLSDDALMQFYDSILDSSLEAAKGIKVYNTDPTLLMAVNKEVHRRLVFSGWFWRRQRKPDEYKMWVRYIENIKEKAHQIRMEMVSRVK